MAGRNLAVLIAVALLAGCSSGGATLPHSGPGVVQPQSSSLDPATSPAGRHLLAKAGTAATQRRTASSGRLSTYDDGGWSTLQLPTLEACANGAYSNDCANWEVPNPNRVGQSQFAPGTPVLNFCSAAASYPQATLGAPAEAVQPLAPTTFSLTYTGSQSLPIESFNTEPFVASLSNGFAANAASATMTLTPELKTTAGRGWLLFFTWSWPTDLILVPYQVNEIQLAQESSPVITAPATPGTLGSFDCLGQGQLAIMLGQGVTFGTSGPFGWPLFTTSSTGAVLQATVTATTSNPSATILVADDRFATALATVVSGNAPATPTPAPTATPAQR